MAREKDEVLQLIERLPDDVTTADIMEELYFKEQVARGLSDLATGRTISHAELKNRMAQWRTSAGR